MKFSHKLVILSLVIAGASLSYANSKPNKCPSVSAIQAYGVNSTGAIPWTFFAHTGLDELQKYDTDNRWFFSIGHECGLFDNCQAPKDLLNKANTALKTLKFARGPVKEGDSWACHYKVNDKYFDKIFARTW